MQREEHNHPPLDTSLHNDGGHVRMNTLRNGGENISLRECSLPPEDLPPHVEGVDKKKKSHTQSSSSRDKDGKKKKGKKKKKSDKERKCHKEKKSKKPDLDAYQEIPSESKSSREKTRKKKDAQRAIPESLTGREVSWSRSYLKDAEEIPFREDLLKAPKTSRRRRRRRKSNEEAPVQEVRLDVVEETQKEITLDPDGFPIGDNDSVHSLDMKGFVANSAGAHKFDDSFTSTEKSHAGSNFQDSPTSIKKSLLDSHLQLQESLTSIDQVSVPTSNLQDSFTSITENSQMCSNPESPVGGGGLQKFFQQQGRDEMAAISTAAAFEAFLRKQHDRTSEKGDSDHSSYSWSVGYKEDDEEKGSSSDDSDDPFSHTRFGASERTLLSGDDGDIKSFEEHASKHDEWSPFGLVRRNEAFVKRVSSKDLIKSTSEGTLRSSVSRTHSTTRTRTDSQTLSTLGTKESPPRKVVPPWKVSLSTKRPKNLAPLASARSLDELIPRERTLERQLASLSLSQRACVNALKFKWEKQNGANHWFPDDYYLRFARCSPGDPFNFTSAWKVMKRFDWHYYEVSMSKMEATVLTKAAFPVPGLKTKGGRNVFYMRPSRYFPRKAPTDNMIDLVVYVMNCMLEKEHGSVHGLGLVANMAGWKMENFSVSYWHKFLMTLQGHRVPTRISAFLIIDPPSWFGSIWTIMKPMMSDDFREKVVVVSSDELENYLMVGYRDFLPDDMEGGRLSTDTLVKTFTAERKAIEGPGRWR